MRRSVGSVLRFAPLVFWTVALLLGVTGGHALPTRILALILSAHAAISGQIPPLVVAWSLVTGALGLRIYHGYALVAPAIGALISGPHLPMVGAYTLAAAFVLASVLFGGDVDRFMRNTPADRVAPPASLQHHGDHGRES